MRYDKSLVRNLIEFGSHCSKSLVFSHFISMGNDSWQSTGNERFLSKKSCYRCGENLSGDDLIRFGNSDGNRQVVPLWEGETMMKCHSFRDIWKCQRKTYLKFSNERIDRIELSFSIDGVFSLIFSFI